jgi:hypothetical protein
MPLKAINYDNTHFYKICCNDVNINEIYIGRTTNFTKRKQKHKYSCNNENDKEHHKYAYQFIRNNGGWINWSMVLIDTMKCDGNLEADKIEREYIEKFKAMLNKNIPTRTSKEYYEAHKEKSKEYYEAHKEKSKEYYEANKEQNKERTTKNCKAYHEANKENINQRHKQYREANKEKSKEYYEANKERINEQRKQYREANKEQISQHSKEYRANKLNNDQSSNTSDTDSSISNNI